MSGRLPALLMRTPFDPDDLLAQRADPEDVAAMAVLAYTNMWDRLINHYLMGGESFVDREDDRRKLTEEEYAQRLAPVVAFFAPLAVLNSVSSDAIAFTAETIALQFMPGVTKFKKLQLQTPACQLRLTVAPERDAQFSAQKLSETLVDDIVTKIVLPVIRGKAGAQELWRPMLQELTSKLDAALQATPRPLYLYHGCSVAPGTTPEAKFAELSRLFVSTTDSYQMATGFAHSGVEGQTKWVFKLAIAAGVRVARVHDILSPKWQCWAGEEETVLAPGARFELEGGAPTEDGAILVWTVRVTV